MALAAVFQIGSLGDSIVSIPSLLSLRELLPDCEEYVLVTGFQTNTKLSAAAVFDMAWKSTASVDYWASGSRLRRLTSAAAVIARLRMLRPKYCVYLMPSERTERQATRDSAFFRAAGVNQLIGFRALTHEERRFAANGPDMKAQESYLRFRRLWNDAAASKFLNYARPPFIAPSAIAQEEVQRWLERSRKMPGTELVAFCPFSNWSSKDMPHQTAVEVLRSVERDFGVEIAVLGGSKDRDRAQRLISEAKAGINACGCFSIDESAALLSACSLAVCVDSGPMHLAGALDVRCVSVFSRVNPVLSQWFPIARQNSILYQDVPCAGCKLECCTVAGHPCMTRTEPVDILAALTAHIEGRRGPANVGSSTRVLSSARQQSVFV